VQPGVQRARTVCLLEQPVLAAARAALDGRRRLQLAAADAAQALARWLSVRCQLHAEQVHRSRIVGREVGFPNQLRGDGYIGADIGISKAFELPSSQRLRFRWEVFNVTNTQRFNTADVSMTPDTTSTLGRYNSVLGTCDGRAGRCMQASLKYEF
jgi:hypothetical protein